MHPEIARAEGGNESLVTQELFVSFLVTFTTRVSGVINANCVNFFGGGKGFRRHGMNLSGEGVEGRGGVEGA